MDDHRQKLKDLEIRFLAEEYKKYPELFPQKTFIEDTAALHKFGIHIKGKEKFAKGYFKFSPQDFIVEEILPGGTICTITRENVLAAETPIAEAPTYYATIVKYGLSTFEAIEDMARKINCKTTQIGYAGIKDKDAITAQRISFRGITPAQLKTLGSPYYFLKDIESGKGVMEKGRLQGNRFTILVRTEKSFFTKETIAEFGEHVKETRDKGFYNFFYLQRFGNPRYNNFRWATYLLQGDYERALKGFLTDPGDRETPYFKNIRKKLSEQFGKWAEMRKTLEPFPMIAVHEHKVLAHLEKNPQDITGALNQIADQVGFWLAALTSLFFNQKLSAAIEFNENVPKFLPLFLSNNPEDWMFYKTQLADNDLLPPPIENLKPFPFIQLAHREISTREHVHIDKIDIIDEGVVFSFTLSKGEYATTFLAHFFNLVSGTPPEDISTEAVDIKAAIQEPEISQTLAYFEAIKRSKGTNILEKISKGEM